ncbi:MAG: sirohydrochlorin nickelochelatase [Euryarchaeota archaeon]|nr:sirohydrochlorin nickelochelatase [Euryarchaeota archaeon]
MREEGILVIGHGSKLDHNKNVVTHYAERLEKRMSPMPVLVGFMNINTPTIRESLVKLAASGTKTVYVIPCFLAHGIHTRDDITGELGIPQGSKGGKTKVDGKDIDIRYCEPIGLDERVTDVLEDRLRERMQKE